MEGTNDDKNSPQFQVMDKIDNRAKGVTERVVSDALYSEWKWKTGNVPWSKCKYLQKHKRKDKNNRLNYLKKYK